ncbi:pantoate--beta-alanine ligase [Kangiella sp. TOML190]|uniref:pantoate--beta-alanine ligase n=1 Tax=Kangiella sp. TOML190 TaxID=2931351 RepID=UPI00203E31A3|nr:pantoate--beta-alanine ligase [Kangiella sp. TOML190]
MIIVNTIKELQTELTSHRQDGKRIGFVPTMGNLHQGHLSLVEVAKRHSDIVVVSLFVNPTQFGPNEDFDSYPRTLDADCDKLKNQGTDIVFAPATDEVYPKWPNITSVHVAKLGKNHCGASRPGHFDGVTTVVSKLFNMVRPDCAVFGEKDFQQISIIRRMVSDLNFPLDIIGAPIVREANGLAMSSRNGYLSTEEKDHASNIYKTLLWAKSEIENGRHDFRQLETEAKQRLTELGFVPDYFNIANQETLALAQEQDSQLVILLAAFMGKVRLIDNIKIK